MSKKEEELKMWFKWKESKDKKELNALLTSLNPLIEREVNVFKTVPLPKDALKLRALSLTKKAFNTYDPSKSQLNTHVVNNLKKLKRYVYEYQNIGKIPEHRILRITQYKSVVEQLKEKLFREPTAMEVASEMKLPVIEVERLETELRQDLTIRNDVVGEDSGSTFYLDPQKFTDTTVEAIHFVYYSLTDPEEQKIVEHYFGIFGKEKKSALALSKELGIPYSKVIRSLKTIAEDIEEVEKNLN